MYRGRPRLSPADRDAALGTVRMITAGAASFAVAATAVTSLAAWHTTTEAAQIRAAETAARTATGSGHGTVTYSTKKTSTKSKKKKTKKKATTFTPAPAPAPAPVVQGGGGGGISTGGS